MKVSIVIPTRNGGATLTSLLDAVAAQQTRLTIETVAVDSGSTDGTLDLLRRRASRVVEIPPEAFNHGTTRNLGIAATDAELVVLLVQDAVPASPDWLEELTAPLRADPGVAGSWARQVPQRDASAVARHHLARAMATSAEPRTLALPSAAALEALAPLDRAHACGFDNVCSCLRRAAWARHPFPETPIAEDLEWARGVLLAGWRLAYAPRATVFHSHDRSARYELHRTYLLHQRLRHLFGVRTVPTRLRLARAILGTAALHLALAARDPHRRTPAGFAHALALAVAWPLGQYLGARSADTGRELLRPSGV